MTEPPDLSSVVDVPRRTAELLEVLDLKELGTAQIAVTGIDGADAATSIGATEARVFEAPSQPMPHGRVFGGQVLAQCVMAAGLTVADVAGPQRFIHSLHGYFMRAGDDKAPIRFAVEEMRDGGTFSTRRVHAVQHGAPIMSFTASFQQWERGLEHQDPMPQVPEPDTLPSMVEILAGSSHPWAARVIGTRPIEHRPVSGHAEVLDGPHPGPVQFWIRAMGEIPEDPLLNAAILAYASDYTLLEPALRQHGISWTDPRLRVASLDHSMWFHRPATVTDWILYTQDSPSAESGKALGVGRMFSRDGRLVATVAQQGMMRLKDS